MIVLLPEKNRLQEKKIEKITLHGKNTLYVLGHVQSLNFSTPFFFFLTRNVPRENVNLSAKSTHQVNCLLAGAPLGARVTHWLTFREPNSRALSGLPPRRTIAEARRQLARCRRREHTWTRRTPLSNAVMHVSPSLLAIISVSCLIIIVIIFSVVLRFPRNRIKTRLSFSRQKLLNE